MPSGPATPPDDFTEAVMVQFREMMAERELTVTALGLMTGIDRSSLSKILRCRVQPMFSQVRAIAIALQIPVPQLMARAEAAVPPGYSPFRRS